MSSPRRPSRALTVADALVASAVAVLYVGAAKFGLAMAIDAPQVTAVWPPTGLALAAVWIFGRRAVAGVLLGAFAANASLGEPLWVAAGIAVGNTLEAVAGVAILRRAGFDAALARSRDVLALFAALAVAPVVAATVGVAFLGAGGVQPAGSLAGLWWLWWLGDALGGLVFAPLLFVWTRGGGAPRRRFAVVEAVLLLSALIVGNTLAFTRPPPAPLAEYIVFPFLMWGALRFGPVGSATAAAVTDAIAVWATHLGLGPFAGAGPEQGLVLLQIFMAVATATGLLLGAVAAEQRRAREELRRQTEQLSETDRRKDEFLAMLSHELRNPLAPILHAAELLGHGDAELVRQAREIIRRQAAHLTRLVDDLLDVSRITRGTVRVERRTVDLEEVVDAAVDTWRHLILQRNQELKVELPKEALRIEGDPTRLAQIVSNLLHNAAKFTPEGGRISISAAREEGLAIVRVRDTGRGMAPEELERVFDLFVQGPPPLDRPQGGLGLGLTLARRLAELHKGRIEARSDGPGRGSDFVVRIPLSERTPEEGPSDSARQPDAPVRARPRRVLIVDDHEDAREALRFLLEDEGHDVRTAGDGPSALSEAERFSPEVVLLDIGLPGIDGYEVARAMRRTPQGRDVLLVAVSGYGLPEDRARSRDAGFDGHLLKPVAPQVLLDLVRQAS
ncbi:MAG TPA: MASE1 domain-containing protein [Thermoanaerobaculia bacterium]|nr:MASE1 domain-containing protein [Thermoanaerobaculia bacterium]